MQSGDTKIAVFYHVYQTGDWLNLFAEQTQLLTDSGLLEVSEFIHVGINGDSEMPYIDKKYIYFVNENQNLEEGPTLSALANFASNNEDFKILYLHTKGVSQPMPETTDWRRIMEYFCVEKWQDCISKLDTHDAVGCLYMDECYYGFFPHFSGNFWWANASYINRLDHSYLNGGLRQNREFWIGTGNGSLFSFHTTGLNHYAHEYPRHLYAN